MFTRALFSKRLLTPRTSSRRRERRPDRGRSLLGLQPLEPRLAMAGDFSLALDGDAYAIKAEDAKYAEVAPFAQGPSVGSPGDLTKMPFLDAAGKDAVRLVNLYDRMRDIAAAKQAEQAGIDREFERESRVIDHKTGDPITIGGNSKYGVSDSGFGGRPGAVGDPRDWRSNSKSGVFDSGFGGGDGPTGPSQDDMLAAGRAGKGRAMDDDGVGTSKRVVTYKTTVGGGPSFREAWTWATTVPGFADYQTPLGPARFMAGGGGGECPKWVYVEYEVDGKTQKELFVLGEKGPRILSDRKPRPDDDGNAAPRQLTDDEKQAVLKELRSGFGPAGKPRDDQGAGAGGYNGPREMLTYLDLAGQPRIDDERHRGGVDAKGPVLTDVGLAGQPVGDDPNFGVVIVGGGGLQPPGPKFGDGRG